MCTLVPDASVPIRLSVPSDSLAIKYAAGFQQRFLFCSPEKGAGDGALQKFPLLLEGHRSSFFIEGKLNGTRPSKGRIPAARNVAELCCQLNEHYQKILSP